MTSVKVDLMSTIQTIIKFIPPDFTIITNDGPYQCHKLLAAAQSNLIRDHVTSDIRSSEIILDFNDKKGQFNLIINLFNGQEIEIDEENAFFLLNAASILKFPWLTNQIRHLTIQKDGSNAIDYNPESPLNGILSYVQQFYPKSINIKASSSTIYGNPESLIYQHISGEYWESQSMQPNPWFQISINDKKINLVGYVLQTTSNASDSRNPNSWIVAGSNDGENWHTLSQIDKKSDLYEPNISVLFECNEKENDEAYSMFRFEMTEPTYQGDWTFRICRVELYGDLIGEIAEKDPILIKNPDAKEEVNEINEADEKDNETKTEESTEKPDEQEKVNNEETIEKVNEKTIEKVNNEETLEKVNEETIEKVDDENHEKPEQENTEKVENEEKQDQENISEETNTEKVEEDADLPQIENGVVGIGYEEENPLKGVFYYLHRTHPDSVEITVSSTSYGDPSNLISQSIDGNYWESSSGNSNPWFQITLKDAKLDIIGYVLRTTFHSSDSGYPNSWILAGSNDGEEWFTLDQVDNRSSLIESDTSVAFECADKDSEEPFRIFRFEMTEQTVDRTWSFRLSRVELFGDLYIDDTK